MSGINGILYGDLSGVCLVGVDPGKTVGIGIIFRGDIVGTRKFVDFDRMVEWLRNELRLLDFEELIIRIGSGGSEYNEPIVDLLFKEFGSVGRLEIVNETNTSKRVEGRSRHEEAALRIAQRYGVELG